MQVILLEKIDKVGQLGDLVDVKAGFARNFLLPQGKAQQATPENLERFNELRAAFEKEQAEALASANARKDALNGMTVSITSRAGTEGKLFGSIGAEEIRAAFEAAGKPVEKKEVRLPEGPLRVVGEHPVTLHLHTDVNAEVTVNVVGEEA